MQEEFDALQRNQIWELVPQPPRANVITDKWVFKHKLRLDGTLERYKARWVVRSFRQRAGADFTDTHWARETYSSVHMWHHSHESHPDGIT